jgi:hypothetical protein
MKIKIFLSGLLSLSLLSVANATVYNASAGFSGENRGSFNNADIVLGLGDRWKVQDGSYQVRSLGTGFGVFEASRNYHIFDIPTLAANEVVTGVSFSIPHSGNSYNSSDATETFELFDIDVTNFADIRVASSLTDTRDISILRNIYADLGSGISYGTVTSSAADNGTTQLVSMSLSQSLLDALTTIGHAGGGDFGIGGALNSNDQTTAGAIERIFRGTSNFASLSSLEITTSVSAVPVPAAVWLFGTGLLGLVGVSKRRAIMTA